MPTLTLGAALSAATNLLYADLAVGGATMSAVSNAIGFTWAVEQFGGSEKLARLMITIGGENFAIGIAGAAYIAWLSSIVAKGYSAVQYALLASLTLLVGTLGRGALGQMIEERGYYFVFIFTALIGVVAVVLCVLEWIREARAGRASGVVAPEHAEAVPAEVESVGDLAVRAQHLAGEIERAHDQDDGRLLAGAPRSARSAAATSSAGSA